MGVTQSMAQISKVGGQEWGVCWLGKGGCLFTVQMAQRKKPFVNMEVWELIDLTRRQRAVGQMDGGRGAPSSCLVFLRQEFMKHGLTWACIFKCVFGYKAVTVNNWTGDMPLCASLNTGYT